MIAAVIRWSLRNRLLVLLATLIMATGRLVDTAGAAGRAAGSFRYR